MAPVASLDAARRRQPSGRAAVAATVVLLAATGFLLTRADDSGTGSSEPDLVAATTLDPLEPVGEAGAEARLVRADGHYQLVLDTHDMAAAPDASTTSCGCSTLRRTRPRHLLGPMTGSTTVPLPDGVDPHRVRRGRHLLQAAGQTEHSSHSLPPRLLAA